MDNNSYKVIEDNLKTYNQMTKYVRNLKMLDVHKRIVIQKLYSMHNNLSKKEVKLKEYIVNPKIFCDTICKDYIDKTPIYMVYLETIKNFNLVIAIICLSCDIFLKKSYVSKYFIDIIIGTFIISIILTYLRLYRSKNYGLSKEPLTYKVIYNIISLIMIVPIFLAKDLIMTNETISTLSIGLICIIIYFISSIIIKSHINKINKKISYKGII